MAAANNNQLTQQIVQEQIDFLNEKINQKTRYVHQWRRKHIANLLDSYNKNIQDKEKLIQTLFNEKEKENKLAEELREQLDEEKKRIDESEKIYQEDARTFAKEKNELEEKNKQLSEMLKMMLKFVKNAKGAFYEFIAEHTENRPMIPWETYVQTLNTMDDGDELTQVFHALAISN